MLGLDGIEVYIILCLLLKFNMTLSDNARFFVQFLKCIICHIT